MTGELCDCFATKRDGVRRILAEVEKAFPAIPIGVWSTNGQFVTAEGARQNLLSVAAANWHALATMVGPIEHAGRNVTRKLLIDIGSTTTDIIPIIKGKPATKGLTDPERLRSKELVYTGTRRTPVCAVASRRDRGRVLRHHSRRLSSARHDRGRIRQLSNCRWRPATAKHAHGRLAHMIGGDAEITSGSETYRLAVRVFEKQQESVEGCFCAVIDRMPGLPEAVIVSGSENSWAARRGKNTQAIKSRCIH